jgi:hypothetical protein
MSTTEGAIVGLLVLSAGGLLPALALARMRLVTIPLVPLCGAVMSSLAVTAMTAIGWSVVGWYVTLSVLGAVAVGAMWWRFPSVRPWGAATPRDEAPHWMNLAAGLGGLIVCVLCLSVLKSTVTGYDTRDIWLMHPLWYLQGHTLTVATLRKPVYAYGHPPYPPFIGGSVALTWLAAGTKSYRLGVVMIALLNTLAIFAAGTAMVGLAARLALSTGRVRRVSIRWAGVAAMVSLMVVAFAVAGGIIADGYADVLWSAAAVGAVTYGLMLPINAANLGAAAILASAAGLTKLEGTLTAAAVVGLIGARYFLARRSDGTAPALVRAGALAVSMWAVIGVWPVLIRLLHAHPDVAFGGYRRGTDSGRLAAAWNASIHLTTSHFVLIAGGVLVAVVAAFFLNRSRRSARLGNDLWAWVVVALELAVIFGAYMVGPGHVVGWVKVTIKRTTTFPLLEVWWIAATWTILAVCGDRSSSEPTVQPVPPVGADVPSTIPT